MWLNAHRHWMRARDCLGICDAGGPRPRCACAFLSLPKHAFSPIRAQMYEIFGKYGAIRQIRVGSTKETRGTAYVVYEDIYDAKNAADHLSGFNVQVRFGLMQGL